MIDLNLSNETCVLYEQMPEFAKNKIKDSIRIFETKEKNYYFLTSKTKRGIIPQILTTLLEQRQIFKNKMEHEKDDQKKAVFNTI